MTLEIISEFIAVTFIIISYCYARLKIASTIEPIFLKKKRNWIYIFIYYIGASFFQIGPIGYLVFYYIIFRYQVKKESRYALFYSLYAFLAYESVYYFFISLAYRFVDSSQWIMFYREGLYMLICLLVLAVALAIHHLIGLNQKIIESEEFLPIIKKTTDYFIGLVGIRFLSIFAYQVFRNEYLEIKVTASLSIFIITLLVMLYLRDQQLKYLHQEIVQQKEQELIQYNRLIDELEIAYDEIRGFRHDYAGIIRSLEPAIIRNNMEEISQIYKEALCQMNYDISQKDYSGFELSYIKNVGFRNIFSQKILQAKDEKIPFKLEVTECIPEVEVPLLATIRILTIVLDNAFEATVMTNNPSIVVGVVVENDRVIVSVKNTYDSSTMQKRYKIWEKGYSTKTGHKGLGLVNLQQLVWEIDSLGLKTEINQNTFTQIISFRTKE